MAAFSAHACIFAVNANQHQLTAGPLPQVRKYAPALRALTSSRFAAPIVGSSRSLTDFSPLPLAVTSVPAMDMLRLCAPGGPFPFPPPFAVYALARRLSCLLPGRTALATPTPPGIPCIPMPFPGPGWLDPGMYGTAQSSSERCMAVASGCGDMTRSPLPVP